MEMERIDGMMGWQSEETLTSEIGFDWIGMKMEGGNEI
jgi:hypothetical protein